MASVYDYKFDSMGRIGCDSNSVDQRSLQNTNHADYMLHNYRPLCPMDTPINFATSQPNINFKGSHQVGINGCNVDNNSDVMINKLSRDKCKISLQERMFATVPYIGRGKVSTDLESELIQGDLSTVKKSLNPTSEESFMKYSNTPMLPELENNITKPENCIESVHEGWIRGGIPSRELEKDKDYNN